MSQASERRAALADFLKSRRAALPPASLGIRSGARRRTPGLRREELAQAAGISATWYTWIEQGRDVSVSPQALSRLAQTLHLSPAERAYLFELAEKRDPRLPDADASAVAPPALIASVQSMAVPAYVLDRSYTAVAWNDAAADLFVGWLDEDSDRNLLRYIFLNPAAKKLIGDWEDRSHRVQAEFRADVSRTLDDPAIAALIADLRRRSVLFDAAWQRQAVTVREGGLRRFTHPRHGKRSYEQLTFAYAPRPEFKLTMLMPATG